MKNAITVETFWNNVRKTGRNPVPFIGSGFSAMVRYEDDEKAVFKDWNEFNKELLGSDYNDIYDRLKSDPEDIAEYYIRKQAIDNPENIVNVYNNDERNAFVYGKGKFIEFIKKKFEVKFENKKIILAADADSEKKPRPVKNLQVHYLLKQKFDYIYTTNWDNLLEQVTDYESVYRNTHMNKAKVRNREEIVIKFHGHIETDAHEDGNPLVCCKTDYLHRILNENPFDIIFKNDLLYNDFMFMGYSFRDPNIVLVIYQISRLLESAFPKGQPKKIYWLITDFAEDPRLSLFNSTNIQPVCLLNDLEVEELQNLYGEISEMCKDENCKITLTNKNPKKRCQKCRKRERKESEFWYKYNNIRFKAMHRCVRELRKKNSFAFSH